MELDIKKGHFKKIEGDNLKALMKSYFGNVKESGGKLVSEFGALRPITVWLKGKNVLCVEIETDRMVDDSVAMDSIKARNGFLLDATGFSTKERSKRLQKKAKEGKL
jgi:hypothetical protein